MANVQNLRERYVRLNGARPASQAYAKQLESELGVTLPSEFTQVLAFFDGSGFAVLPLHAIAPHPATNALTETKRLRTRVALPEQFVVLGEPPESMLLLDCADGSVLWCDAADVPQIGKQPLKREPDKWDTYLDFFEYMLDEEEADRGEP
jgi:hypothetical protein